MANQLIQILLHQVVISPNGQSLDVYLLPPTDSVATLGNTTADDILWSDIVHDKAEF